jgi:hypothetical protein
MQHSNVANNGDSNDDDDDDDGSKPSRLKQITLKITWPRPANFSMAT